MTRLPKTAADCNSNPASNNNAASAGSNHTENASERGGDKQHPAEDKWILFNPELAELMGGKDGIICAVLAYGIYLWLKTPTKPFGYNPRIDGRKAAYRSTRELMAEYSINGIPLWDDTTILNAVKRLAKKKCGFILDASKKQLHFTMTEKMLKMHSSTKGFLGFKLSEAVKYGVLEAMLLANLDYQVDEFENLLTDEDENIYAELSATKLTDKEYVDLDYRKGRILPVSKDAVDDALRKLRDRNGLIQHPVRKSFYRRSNATEKMPKLGCNGSKQGGAKISNGEAKISSGAAKISSDVVQMLPKCRNNNDLQTFAQSLDSNTDSKIDRKCVNSHSESSLRSDSQCEFGNMNTSPDEENEMMHELRGREEIGHELITHEEIIHKPITHEHIDEEYECNVVTHQEIMDELLANDELVHEQITHELISDEEYNQEFISHEEIAHSLITPDIDGVARHVGCNIGPSAKILLDAIKNTPLLDIYSPQPLTPYAVYKVRDIDEVEFIGYELPYDFIPLDWNTGKPYSRAAEIDYSIKDLKTLLRSDGIAYKASEIDQIRHLFIDEPLLTLDHVSTLLRWCEPRVEPMYIGDWSGPEKGHDSLYWGRRIKTFAAFLKYLPDIIKEWYRNEMMEEYPQMLDEEGEQIEVDYSCMPDPFLSIAFADEPLLLKTYQRFQSSGLGEAKMRNVFQHLELMAA